MVSRPLTPRERWLIPLTAVVALVAGAVAPAWRDALAERPRSYHDTHALDWDRHRVLDQRTVRVWYTGGACAESVDWDVYYGREYVAINIFERERDFGEEAFTGRRVDCVDKGIGRHVDVVLDLEDLGERRVLPGPYRIDL